MHSNALSRSSIVLALTPKVFEIGPSSATCISGPKLIKGIPWITASKAVAHPFWMLTFLILTCVAFSLFGFIIGLWAENFEKLQIVPLLIITPLVFLGGSFYSISMLPPLWQKVTLFNPVLYLVSGFRWSFFEISDVSVGISLLMVIVFLSACIGVVAWIFKSGYKLKQ